MQYQESIKEKKYKPLFGYGYEPGRMRKKERAVKEEELRFDMFGNIIYELPVEAEADLQQDEPEERGAGAELGARSQADNNGFPRPKESPLMALVIALTIAIALFLSAFILSIQETQETVSVPQNQSVMDLCSLDSEYLRDCPGAVFR